jgi:hypothetical protein
MKREWGLLASLGILLTGPASLAQEAGGDALRLEPRLTLRVYNYAGVPKAELAAAMRLTLEILARADVPAEWIDCALTGEDNDDSRVCGSPRSKAELHVRIPLKAPHAFSGLFPFMLGFTTLDDQGNGSYLTVFYERVKLESNAARCSHFVVLGCEIAHEVGHLLLGTNSHSPAGIMAPRWHRRTLDLASKGYLQFSRQEAEIIRKALHRRAAMTSSNR